jgi:RNA polymerase sigma-70 factor, ECF subfamily
MSTMAPPVEVAPFVPLIDQLRAGKPEAFAECVRQHQGLVRAYLSRHIRSAEAADDLAQETFLTAFRRLSSYQGRASLAGWLVGIARNLALDYLRREAHRYQRENTSLEKALRQWQLERVEADVPEEFEAELSALRNCLKDLPAPSRDVVMAHYFEERTAEEIAQEAGKNAGAVRMMLLRVRRMLSACVERRLGRLGREGQV